MDREEMLHFIMVWVCYGIALVSSELTAMGIMYLLDLNLSPILNAAMILLITIILVLIYRVVFEGLKMNKEGMLIFMDESTSDLLKFNLILWALIHLTGFHVWSILTALWLFVVISLFI